MKMRSLTLWCREVDDVSVALEHVDLLNSLDGLYVELLQRSLELLVVGTGALVDLLDLPAGSALASVSSCQLQAQFLWLICYFGCWETRLQYFEGIRGRSEALYGAVEVGEEVCLPCAHNMLAKVLQKAQRKTAFQELQIPEYLGRTYQCAPTPACAPILPDPYLRWRGR